LKTIARVGKTIVERKKAEYIEAQEHGMESKDILTLLSESLIAFPVVSG